VDLPKVEDEKTVQDKLEAKRLKKAMYDAIELQPLITLRLKPIKVDN
jgi:hypothetical protein